MPRRDVPTNPTPRAPTPLRAGRRRAPGRFRALRAATFVLALVPLALTVWDGFTGGLGANPIERVQDRLGFWTLTFLTLSLVPTPAHDLLGLAWPVRLRRMLGLFAFAYASLHLVWYVAIDQTLDLPLLIQDVAKRKFMMVGFAAWLILVPLAVTSTDRWVRRLGYARWKRLHRAVYVAALLGVVHFVWRVKADLRGPAWFVVSVGALLSARVAVRAARVHAARRRAGAPGLSSPPAGTGAAAGGAPAPARPSRGDARA